MSNGHHGKGVESWIKAEILVYCTFILGRWEPDLRIDFKNGRASDLRPDNMFIAHDGTAHFKVGRNGYMVPKENQPQYHLDEYVAVAQKYCSQRQSEVQIQVISD